MLISAGLVTTEQVETALKEQGKSGDRLGSVLVRLGFVDEDKMINFLGKKFNVMTINLNYFEIDESVLDAIPAESAIKYQIIPIEKLGSTLTVAMVDPSNFAMIQDLKFITKCEIEPVITTESSLKEAIAKYYGDASNLEDILGDTLEDVAMDVVDEDEEDFDQQAMELEAEETPLVKMVNQIIVSAIQQGASDIHVEPYEKIFRIRYRIDGVLKIVMNPPLKIRNSMISRIKILSNLDITERRLPQDGKMRIKALGRKIDLRVAIIPCVHGEKIVLRILDKGSKEVSIASLGFEPKQEEDFLKAIKNPWGLILVTGPTGSGKTWTLSTGLKNLNSEGTNIMTAEDPVEFDIPGLNQVQCRPAIGLTFAAALKSFLRMDPNIVMIGEIRDFDTADMAIKAAQTGHLVFSTLHTNSAPDSIGRLDNMNIEPFNVASSLILIVAQRLVRRICKNCKEETTFEPEVLEALQISPEVAAKSTFFKGKGCSICSGTGYKGRTAVFEVMPVGERIRRAIVKRESTIDIKKYAREEGMFTLRESGVLKILAGITSPEEIFHETAADE
ncbi:type IV-A pilus assembly ATPase PilB [Candidatus Dependentiae bacterium]|nr:type IV-A pilus assembly ATPase PilB [Candidatus Dependentiae bacterium]